VRLGLCGIEVVPEASGVECVVRAVGAVDPRVALCPHWLFAFAIRVLGTTVAARFVGACARTEIAQRARTNPAYAPIRQHLAELGLLHHDTD
jgi:hypothetical protein